MQVQESEDSGAVGEELTPRRLLDGLAYFTLASILFGFLEVRYYYNWMGLDRRLLDPYLDKVLLYLFLVAKTLLLLLPVAGLSALLVSRWPRLGRAVLWGGGVSLFLWLSLDIQCLLVSGNHLFFYAPYLKATLLSEGGTELVGGGQTVGAAILRGGFVVLVPGVLLFFLARRLPSKGVAALGPVLLLGLLAPVGFSERNMGWQMNDYLVLRLTPVIRVAAELQDAALDQTIQITALRPQPREPGPEEIYLTNQETETVSLQGWVLKNLKGQELALEGELAPDATRIFTDERFELDDERELLSLFNPEGEIEDQVQYLHVQVEQDRILSLRARHKVPRFLIELNQKGDKVLAELREALVRPQPADGTVDLRRKDGKKQPNVVVLVLESLRRDAITPEKTPDLARLFDQGLTFDRHYTTNASHLGIFSIVYGRVPITYKRDLMALVPPQSPVSFRSAGYENRFYSSTPYKHWVGMDRFLNEHFFEVVSAPEPTKGSPSIGWEKWPEKDSEALEAVKQRLNNDEKPLFAVLFLKATHFPYAYPKEFATRLPDGGGQYELTNWTELPVEQLRNRYDNSVSFLEHEIVKFVEGIDLSNTIVVVTGDHGESFWDDGTLAHGSRASLVQCMVPCGVFGYQTPQKVVQGPTGHQDILPTLFHLVQGEHIEVEGCHGRDVLLDHDGTQYSTMFVPNRFWSPWELVFVVGQSLLEVDIHFDRGTNEPPSRCVAAALLDAQGGREGPVPPEEELDLFLGVLEKQIGLLKTSAKK